MHAMAVTSAIPMPVTQAFEPGGGIMMKPTQINQPDNAYLLLTHSLLDRQQLKNLRRNAQFLFTIDTNQNLLS